MTERPRLPPEPANRGCLGAVAVVLAALLAGGGLLLLIFSGLCTAGFSLNRDSAPLALVIGLPSMAMGYGLWRLGKWLFRRADRIRVGPGG